MNSAGKVLNRPRKPAIGMKDYYSLEEIIITEEHISSTLLTDVKGFGFLDPSSAEIYLRAGAKIDLPLWMVDVLTARNFIKSDIPKIFSDKYQERLHAGAQVIPLSGWCTHYYRLGILVTKLLKLENLAGLLKEVFRVRFRHIILSDHSTETDSREMAKSLTSMEQLLVNCKLRSQTNFMAWRKRKVSLNLRASKYLALDKDEEDEYR
ncbi:DNA replication complex GINS protein PSF3-like [Zophobas morio]|uniref:DNA replication complex GINS protein PSF3-like n=1 Tax=Zophobas morio TaxID=2755281 RepID=UPI003082B298